MVKVLAIVAHPKRDSLNGYILDQVEKMFLKRNFKKIDLYFDKFNPVFNFSKEDKNVLLYQEKIKWAEKIIFIYPVWLGEYPAILKGFFDRVFTPHFAYRYSEKGRPIKLLSGKRAYLIRTFGGPNFFSFFAGRRNFNLIKKSILGFCGIKLEKSFDLYGVNMKSFNEDRVFIFVDKIKNYFEKY